MRISPSEQEFVVRWMHWELPGFQIGMQEMRIVPLEELPRRRPVWEAMSDFFLDTELDEASLRAIAGTLKASGYSTAELEDILETELGPLLYGNLCPWVTIAGIWDGFDVEWIEARIRSGKHRWCYKWYAFLNRWFCDSIVGKIKRDDWARVLQLMQAP